MQTCFSLKTNQGTFAWGGTTSCQAGAFIAQRLCWHIYLLLNLCPAWGNQRVSSSPQWGWSFFVSPKAFDSDGCKAPGDALGKGVLCQMSSSSEDASWRTPENSLEGSPSILEGELSVFQAWSWVSCPRVGQDRALLCLFQSVRELSLPPSWTIPCCSRGVLCLGKLGILLQLYAICYIHQLTRAGLLLWRTRAESRQTQSFYS